MQRGAMRGHATSRRRSASCSHGASRAGVVSADAPLVLVITQTSHASRGSGQPCAQASSVVAPTAGRS